MPDWPVSDDIIIDLVYRSRQKCDGALDLSTLREPPQDLVAKYTVELSELTNGIASGQAELIARKDGRTLGLVTPDYVEQWNAAVSDLTDSRQQILDQQQAAQEVAQRAADHTAPAAAELSSSALRELLRHPQQAYDAWPKLNQADRAAVLDGMERQYDAGFRCEFEESANGGSTGTRELITGDNLPSDTPDRLTSLGYRLSGTLETGGPASVEVWVKPDGSELQRIPHEQTPAEPDAAPSEPAQPEAAPSDDDDNARAAADRAAEEQRLRDLVADDEKAIGELNGKVAELKEKLRAVADTQTAEAGANAVLKLHEWAEATESVLAGELDPAKLISPVVSAGIDEKLEQLGEYYDQLVLAPEYSSPEELRADVTGTRDALQKAIEQLASDKKDLDDFIAAHQ